MIDLGDCLFSHMLFALGGRFSRVRHEFLEAAAERARRGQVMEYLRAVYPTRAHAADIDRRGRAEFRGLHQILPPVRSRGFSKRRECAEGYDWVGTMGHEHSSQGYADSQEVQDLLLHFTARRNTLRPAAYLVDARPELAVTRASF